MAGRLVSFYIIPLFITSVNHFSKIYPWHDRKAVSDFNFLLSFFVGMWYNKFVTASYTGTGRGVSVMEIMLSFIISVTAGVVAYYICKWLDGDE